MLYQANWSRGLAGWHASAGWSVINGALRSDTGSRSMIVPYQPPTSAYTIEFVLQVASVPKDGGWFYITVPSSADRDGYTAGAFNLLVKGAHPSGDHPQFGIQILPDQDNEQRNNLVYFVDWEHRWVANDYRITVRGRTVTFSSNGHIINWATSTRQGPLSTGPFQFTCDGAVLAITELRVLAG